MRVCTLNTHNKASQCACRLSLHLATDRATSGVTVATIVCVCPAAMTFEIPHTHTHTLLLNSITNHKYISEVKSSELLAFCLTFDNSENNSRFKQFTVRLVAFYLFRLFGLFYPVHCPAVFVAATLFVE